MGEIFNRKTILAPKLTKKDNINKSFDTSEYGNSQTKSRTNQKRSSMDPYNSIGASDHFDDRSFGQKSNSIIPMKAPIYQQSVGGFNPSKYAMGGGKYTFGRET
mgnify:CR=1 FL=1